MSEAGQPRALRASARVLGPGKGCGRGVWLGGLALLLLTAACAELREEAGPEPSPGEGSLRIGVQALDAELAKVEVTLIPTKAPALPPIFLQAPPGGGPFSETVNGIRQGHYTLKARALDAMEQPRFGTVSLPIVVLAGVQNQVDLFFAETSEGGVVQAPHFVSIAFSGDPSTNSNFRFYVTGGGGEGALTLSGAPGSFIPAGTDPRYGTHIDWAVPAEAGPVTVTLTLEDEAGRKAHTRIDFTVISLSCDPGEQVCNGVCVDDTDTNPLRCGPTCEDCGAEGVCIDGVCRPDPEFANWPIAPDVLPLSQFEFVEPSSPYDPMDPVEGIVVDKLTGLMWQRTPSTWGAWESSATYCKNLNLGGYDDWRLPTRMELLSIVNIGESHFPPEPVFHGSSASSYWSSSAVAGAATRWAVDFGNSATASGHTLAYSENVSWWRRCVRFSDDYPKKPLGPRHVVDAETVLDTWTGLRWQRQPSATTQSLGQARRTCQALKYEGVTARLPTKRELESLVDVYEGGFPTGLVTHNSSYRYWTASLVERVAVNPSSCDWKDAGFVLNGTGQTVSNCRAVAGNAMTERVRCVWKETPAEWKVCGTLVDVQRDSNHCGDCNIVCGGGERCVAGTCQPVPSCSPSESVCDGQCVDPLSDPLHCGECGNDCGPEGVCIDGICRPDPEFANWPLPPESPPASQYQYVYPISGSYDRDNPDSRNGIVLDTVTNLMWQRSSPTANTANWYDAMNYCENLVIGDYDDWRLATRMELLSILRVDGPILDLSEVFYQTNLGGAAWSWTSTETLGSEETSALQIVTDQNNSGKGEVATGLKTSARPFKCVRFGPRYQKSKETPRYVEQSTTVLDTWTNVRWQKEASPQANLSYDDALTFCSNAGGRLPTKKELESLVDVHRSPAIDPLFVFTGGKHLAGTVIERTNHTNGGSCVNSEAVYSIQMSNGRTRRDCIEDEDAGVTLFRVRCVFD